MKNYPDRRVLARFFGKVRVAPSGCWFWFGNRTVEGYGRFGWRTGLSTTAHRMAYMWFVGAVPDGAVIDHLCRKPECVNPAHMEAVTPRENTARGMWASGFCKRGHAMTPNNVHVVSTTGTRRCRECHRLDGRNRKAAVRRAKAAVRVDRRVV